MYKHLTKELVQQKRMEAFHHSISPLRSLNFFHPIVSYLRCPQSVEIYSESLRSFEWKE